MRRLWRRRGGITRLERARENNEHAKVYSSVFNQTRKREVVYRRHTHRVLRTRDKKYCCVSIIIYICMYVFMSTLPHKLGSIDPMQTCEEWKGGEERYLNIYVVGCVTVLRRVRKEKMQAVDK